MAPILKCYPYAEGATSCHAALVNGIFVFDPAEMKQYISLPESEWIQNIAKANVKLDKIWGHMKMLGPGAPYIANAASTAATNSQLTMCRMTATGLERAIPIAKGRVVMPNLGVTASDWIEAATQPIGARDAGWWNLQHCVSTGNTVPGGSILPLVSPPADLNFNNYIQVAGLSCQKKTGPGFDMYTPQLGRLMSSMDIANNDTDIFSFEHHPDYYFKCQPCILSGPQKAGRDINSDYTVRQFFPQDGTSPVTASLQSGSLQNRDLFPEPTQDYQITSNNHFMVGGNERITRHTLPLEYIYPVPPPTTDESLVQEANLYVIYECGMEVSLRFDTSMPNYTTAALGHAQLFADNVSTSNSNSIFAAPIGGIFTVPV
jgi:hypothetical protein